MPDPYQSFDIRKQAILEEVQPSPAKSDLELLLTHITLYLKRAFHAQTFTDLNLPDHPLFSFENQPISEELASELAYRINIIAEYHLHSPKRISELLTAGLQLYRPMHFNRKQIQYIQHKGIQPELRTMALAKLLETSSRTINRDRQILFTRYGLRVAGILNPPKFGLAHFGIYFSGPSLKTSLRFKQWLNKQLFFGDAFPFLTGAMFDVDQISGVFTLFVPDQVQWLKQLHQTIQWIKDVFLDDVEIHQIRGFFANISLDFYDYGSQQWKISPDLHTEAVLRFIEEHGSQFTPLQGFIYHGEPMAFHPTDWLLTITTCEGLLSKFEQRDLLHHNAFPLSEKTIWTHLRKLRQKEAYFPYLTFSRMAFEDVLCLLISCEKPTLNILYQLITQYPMVQLFPTDDGAIILIGLPTVGPSLIKQLTRTLLTIPRIFKTKILRFKRNLPLLPSLQRHILWRANQRLWKVPPTMCLEE
ncbi:MAG: hypothetical protein ACFE89_04705 [Candidatus Hodarchaeota archaeon]